MIKFRIQHSLRLDNTQKKATTRKPDICKTSFEKAFKVNFKKFLY